MTLLILLIGIVLLAVVTLELQFNVSFLDLINYILDTLIDKK